MDQDKNITAALMTAQEQKSLAKRLIKLQPGIDQRAPKTFKTFKHMDKKEPSF
jgi:hypothetical protein